MISRKEALAYHAAFPAGQIQVMPTKSLKSLEDLSLAYTPGVALPCQEIAQDPNKVYTYTGKGNLVGVITNGTAVLGLKNIGALAAKPVMAAKVACLSLAGIDGYDIEIDEEDPDRLVSIIQAIAPTFGGIILEDIQAPQCFAVEKALQDALQIPVVHDDQHATAIVIAAALKNALLLAGKEIKDLRTVIYGAGAGAIATATLLLKMGLQKSNLTMFDSQGIIHRSRAHIAEAKRPFAVDHPMGLVDAMYGADFFLGLSVGDVLAPEHLLYMAPDPTVFALANPQPEIGYEVAHKVRQDVIMGTGRSDYPNQINNVLAFPYVLRGLLDVQASQLPTSVFLAAVEAIASLVHEKAGSTPEGLHRRCLVPKPLDKRLLPRVATAVARAAVSAKIAKSPIHHWDDYQIYLKQRMQARSLGA